MSNALSALDEKPAEARHSGTMGRFLFENGLSLVLLFSFLALWFAQTLTGWRVYNQQQQDEGQPTASYGAYLATGHFVEATAENWESEFLQMAAFVWLTVFLYQKGSPESKGIEGDEPQDREPDPTKPDAPWPVRKGGWWLKVYSHSLTLAFLLLFAVSFIVHALGGAREYSQERMAQGQPPVSMLKFMGTSEFWFQSMQNWQSEFLAIAAMVLLAVWLRQKGSPESKPVDARHDENE